MPPEARPVPDLTLSPLSLAIPGVTAPQPRSYDLASVDFRYWSAAEAAARGAAFWRQLLPTGTAWQLGDTLPIKLDEGEDFNAFYDRQALNFFHGTAAGRTVYSGESPDIVCHEQGHAVLDAIRPELFDAGSIEAAAFHESFGDMSAILVALQLPTLRAAVLTETGGDLTRSSRLSRLAEQLGWAIRQFSPDAVERDCLRNAVNSFVYTNPEGLPSNAPAASLSSEPHSFSRVFTAAFFEAIAGGFRLAGPNPGEADLQTVSLDLARLLISGILATPIVPEYMSQVAASIVAADAAAEGRRRGKYGDVLKAGFVRHGILSPQSAVSVATMHMAGVAALAHPGMMAIAGPGGPAAVRGARIAAYRVVGQRIRARRAAAIGARPLRPAPFCGLGRRVRGRLCDPVEQRARRPRLCRRPVAARPYRSRQCRPPRRPHRPPARLQNPPPRPHPRRPSPHPHPLRLRPPHLMKHGRKPRQIGINLVIPATAGTHPR